MIFPAVFTAVQVAEAVPLMLIVPVGAIVPAVVFIVHVPGYAYVIVGLEIVMPVGPETVNDPVPAPAVYVWLPLNVTAVTAWNVTGPAPGPNVNAAAAVRLPAVTVFTVKAPVEL